MNCAGARGGLMTDQVHDFLTKPKRIRNEIMSTQSQIQGLRMSILPKAITYDVDKVQTSPSDIMIRYVEKLEKLEKQAEREQDAYLTAQEDIVRACKSLDKEERTIILQRFLEGQSFEDISDNVTMCRRSTFYVYKKALTKIDAIISR